MAMEALEQELAKELGEGASVDENTSTVSHDQDLSIQNPKLANLPYKITKHQCVCGSKLYLINDDRLYDGDLAECDMCTNAISLGQSFYHCPGNPDAHPNGFDICTNCIFGTSSKRKRHNDQPRKEFSNQNSKKQQGNMRPINKVIKTSPVSSKSKTKYRYNGQTDGSQVRSNRVTSVLTDVDLLRTQKKLFRENQEKEQRIDSLQRQLQTVTREKKATDATLKSVKSQVTNLILKNEELERDSQIRVVKSTKSSQNVPMSKNMKHIDDKIGKLESLVTNMYKVLINKHNGLQTKVTLLENKLNAVVKTQINATRKSSQNSNDQQNQFDIFDLLGSDIGNDKSKSNTIETGNDINNQSHNKLKFSDSKPNGKKNNKEKKQKSKNENENKLNENGSSQQSEAAKKRRESAEKEFENLVQTMKFEEEQSKLYQIGDETDTITKDNDYERHESEIDTDDNEEPQ